MSQVLRKEQCPICADRGLDRHKDNLAIYSDGHSHCYSCGYHTPSHLGNQIRALEYKHTENISLRSSNKLETSLKVSNDSSYSSRNWPLCVHDWLSSYGIHHTELQAHGVFYEMEKHQLVFPCYDGDVLMVSNSRYFGPNTSHPKYITRGSKTQCYKLFQKKDSRIFILTEDFISALKVGRHFNAIPLLGAHFGPSLIHAILRYDPILRIWLDFNKSQEAIKLTKRSSQWIKDCGTIITEKDPKEYNDTRIIEIVTATLSSTPKRVPTR